MHIKNVIFVERVQLTQKHPIFNGVLIQRTILETPTPNSGVHCAHSKEKYRVRANSD